MHGMYVHHVCMHIYVCTCVCVFSWKPAEGIRPFGAGLTGGCKEPAMSAGYLGTSPLQGQYMLLSTVMFFSISPCF